MIVRCGRAYCGGTLTDEPEIDGMVARCCTLCGDRVYRTRDDAIERAILALVRASFATEYGGPMRRGRPHRRTDDAALNLAVAVLNDQRKPRPRRSIDQMSPTERTDVLLARGSNPPDRGFLVGRAS